MPVLKQKCHTRQRDLPGSLLGIPGGSKLAALPDGLVRDDVPASMPGIHRYPGHIRHSSTLSRQDVWETFPSSTALRTDVTANGEDILNEGRQPEEHARAAICLSCVRYRDVSLLGQRRPNQ